MDVKEYYRQIYMNADDFVETANDGIVLKQMNEVDRVLVYNKEFDKMVNYHLRPSVDIEKEERDKHEENDVNEEGHEHEEGDEYEEGYEY